MKAVCREQRDRLQNSATRWNLFCNIADGAFSGLAFSLVAPMFVVSPFLKKIGVSDTLNGLLAAIQPLTSTILPLLVVHRVEMMRRKKPFVLATGFILRLNGFFIAALTAFLLPSTGKADWLFMTLYALSAVISMVAGQAGGPAWTDMLAKITPLDRRGFLFSWRSNVSIIPTLAAAGMIGYALSSIAFPYNYAVLFLGNGIAFMLSLACIVPIRERGNRVAESAAKPIDFIMGMPALLRQNPNFANYVLSRGLMAIASGMVTIFMVLTAQGRFPWLPADVSVKYFLVQISASFIGNMLFGRIGDKFGHKKALRFEAPLFVASCLWAIVAPTPISFGAVFVLLGLATSIASVSGLPILMEFGQPSLRPRLYAVYQTLFGLMSVIGAPLGGLLRDRVGVTAGYVGAIFFALTGLTVLLTRVADPRRTAMAVETAG